MAQKGPPRNEAKPGQSREDRLKAALKANLARRKAQARMRAEQEQTVGKTGKSEG